MKKFTAIVVALLLASLVFVGCAPRESTEGVHGESSFSDGFEASDDSVGDSAEAPASEYAEESISEEAWVEESSEAEVAEAECWSCQLSAPGPHQVPGGLRHCQVPVADPPTHSLAPQTF